MKYETVVCSEMPMFPAQMVSLLQLSNLDLVMNELPAVEDLSASVDTPRIILQCYLVRSDLSGIDYSSSHLRPGENENRLLHT